VVSTATRHKCSEKLRGIALAAFSGMRLRWAVFALAMLAGCQRSAPSPADTSSPSSAPERPVATTGRGGGPVSVDFQNVHFRLGPGIVLEVRHLQGALVARRPELPPVFDDVGSYSLRIDAGEVAMTPASMTALLNTRVFNYDGAPLSDVEVSIEDGHVKQKGTLRKGIPVPFTILADIAATKDGRIRLRPVSVKAVGMPVDGLMGLLHLELDDLVGSNRARGFEAQEDDLLLWPDRLLPDPKISGHLTRIRIEGNRFVQTFGSSPPAHATGEVKNYMHYRGNQLRFGRLTMDDTDMQLIDVDPSDPFDFSPREYVRHLVAGYSKNTADGRLRVYMPDYTEASRADLRPGPQRP
jgi:hypothetical protein